MSAVTDRLMKLGVTFEVTESLKVRTEDLFRNEPVTVATLTRLSEAEERLVE